MTGDAFRLSFSWPMRILMTPLLAGPRRCRLCVEPDRVDVVMGAGGWAFAASVPRPSITRVERARGPVRGWGAHGWRGRWLVNGSSRGRVRLTIEPKAPGRFLLFPLHLRELTVSVDEPDAVIGLLRGR